MFLQWLIRALRRRLGMQRSSMSCGGRLPSCEWFVWCRCRITTRILLSRVAAGSTILPTHFLSSHPPSSYPFLLLSCSLALLLSCSLALLLSCSLALLLSCSLALLLSCSLALLLPLTSSRSCSFAPSQLLSASSSARPTAIRLSDPRRQHVHVHPLIPRRQGRVPPDAFDGAEEYGVYDEDDLANELDDPNVARGLQAGPSGT
jgi:hypothetical protein